MTDAQGPIPMPHSAQMLAILERIVTLNEQVVKQNHLIVNAITLPQMLVKRSDYDRSKP
jgi:hypothetical protein